MKLKLFQIYYDKSQTWALNEGAVPYFNEEHTPIFENQVIIDIYNNGEYKDAEYIGVTSWRLTEKTGLSYKKLLKFIEEDSNDVYIYGSYSDAFDRHNEGYIKEAIDIIYTAVLPGENKNRDWVNSFCNYWIVRKEVFEEYMKWFMKIHKNLQTSGLFLKIVNEEKELYRGQYYPRDVFIYEYIFGLFLVQNPHLTRKFIPSLTNTKRHTLLEETGQRYHKQEK